MNFNGVVANHSHVTVLDSIGSRTDSFRVDCREWTVAFAVMSKRFFVSHDVANRSPVRSALLPTHPVIERTEKQLIHARCHSLSLLFTIAYGSVDASNRLICENCFVHTAHCSHVICPVSVKSNYMAIYVRIRSNRYGLPPAKALGNRPRIWCIDLHTISH